MKRLLLSRLWSGRKCYRFRRFKRLGHLAVRLSLAHLLPSPLLKVQVLFLRLHFKLCHLLRLEYAVGSPYNTSLPYSR